MSIVIPMEMPECCIRCRFEAFSIYGKLCRITGKHSRIDGNENGSKRHTDCPLVELPPQDNSWHTGEPTEDGDYLTIVEWTDFQGRKNTEMPILKYKNGSWEYSKEVFPDLKIIVWWHEKITTLLIKKED